VNGKDYLHDRKVCLHVRHAGKQGWPVQGEEVASTARVPGHDTGAQGGAQMQVIALAAAVEAI